MYNQYDESETYLICLSSEEKKARKAKGKGKESESEEGLLCGERDPHHDSPQCISCEVQ